MFLLASQHEPLVSPSPTKRLIVLPEWRSTNPNRSPRPQTVQNIIIGMAQKQTEDPSREKDREREKHLRSQKTSATASNNICFQARKFILKSIRDKEMQQCIRMHVHYVCLFMFTEDPKERSQHPMMPEKVSRKQYLFVATTFGTLQREIKSIYNVVHFL